MLYNPKWTSPTALKLAEARGRITLRENWWDGHEALAETKSCAVMALARSGVIDMRGPAMNALALAMGVDLDGVVVFNDTHTHEEVLAAFDRGIAAS